MSDLTFVLSDPEALARFREAVDLAVSAYGAITPRARAVLAERGVAVGVHPDDVEAVLDGIAPPLLDAGLARRHVGLPHGPVVAGVFVRAHGACRVPRS